MEGGSGVELRRAVRQSAKDNSIGGKVCRGAKRLLSERGEKLGRRDFFCDKVQLEFFTCFGTLSPFGYKLKCALSARPVIKRATAMMTRPIPRAARPGPGNSRSAAMATVTRAMAPRFITPVTSRTAIRPEQHRAQSAPRRMPRPQALRAS